MSLGLVRYIGKLYLSYFFLIAFALSFLFAGLDFIQHVDQLQGFNIQILYLFYKGLYGLDLVFPLALVLAMVTSQLTMIRSNALLSFYALGFSKKGVLAPFLAFSTLLTLLYIGLHSSDFVDAQTYAERLLHDQKSQEIKKDLFVKYNDSFIYIQELIPEQKLAKHVRVYRMHQGGLYQSVATDYAYFDGQKWRMSQARIVTMPPITKLGAKGFRLTFDDNYVTLEGFKPEILTSVFEGRRYVTIPAAWEAIGLLVKQQLQTQKIRNLLYYLLIGPLFAPLLMVILFYYLPPHARGANLLLYTFGASGAALLAWGAVYLLYRIGRSGAIVPEWGIPFFVALFSLGAAWVFWQKSRHI